ncbi:hypothetical protein M1N84_03745 [Dehalococcoidia bacterium]|nr:hypothetical protein [Dehalococcoidia bacterium]MCL0093014.1 hypothetical protein [Dehalococcoidia bacterium]
MTIILAIAARNGVIIASDGQITSGPTRTTGKKIKKLNEKCLWGASGELALIQRIEEGFDALTNKNQPLLKLRDILSQSIRQKATEFSQSVGSRPISADFVFVEYHKEPMILHIALDGTAEKVEKRFASGIGDIFTYALLRKYEDLMPDKIDVEKAAFLAYKTIAETIEVGSYGLGPPIDVWKVITDKVHNFTREQITGLEETYLSFRKEEIRLFLGEEE